MDLMNSTDVGRESMWRLCVYAVVKMAKLSLQIEFHNDFCCCCLVKLLNLHPQLHFTESQVEYGADVDTLFSKTLFNDFFIINDPMLRQHIDRYNCNKLLSCHSSHNTTFGQLISFRHFLSFPRNRVSYTLSIDTK